MEEKTEKNLNCDDSQKKRYEMEEEEPILRDSGIPFLTDEESLKHYDITFGASKKRKIDIKLKKEEKMEFFESSEEENKLNDLNKINIEGKEERIHKKLKINQNGVLKYGVVPAKSKKYQKIIEIKQEVIDCKPKNEIQDFKHSQSQLISKIKNNKDKKMSSANHSIKKISLDEIEDTLNFLLEIRKYKYDDLQELTERLSANHYQSDETAQLLKKKILILKMETLSKQEGSIITYQSFKDFFLEAQKLSKIYPDDSNITKINIRLDIISTMAEDKVSDINKILTLELLEKYPRVAGYIDYTQELMDQQVMIKATNIIKEIDRNDFGENINNENKMKKKKTLKNSEINQTYEKERLKEDMNEEIIISNKHKNKEKIKEKEKKLKVFNSHQEEKDREKNGIQQKEREIVKNNILSKDYQKETQKSKPKCNEKNFELADNLSESDKFAILQKKLEMIQKEMKLLQKRTQANEQQKDNSKIIGKLIGIDRAKSPEKNNIKEKFVKKIIIDVPIEIDCIRTIRDILQDYENLSLNPIKSLEYSNLIYRSFPEIRSSKEKFLQFTKLLTNILKHNFISKHLILTRFDPQILSNILKKDNLELKNYEKSLKIENLKQNLSMADKTQNKDYEVPIKKLTTKKSSIDYDAFETGMINEVAIKPKKLKGLILKSEIPVNPSTQIEKKLFINLKKMNSSGEKQNLLKKLLNKTKPINKIDVNTKNKEKYSGLGLASKSSILENDDDLTRFSSDAEEANLDDKLLYLSNKEPKYFPLKSVIKKQPPILYDPDDPDTNTVEEARAGTALKGLIKIIDPKLVISHSTGNAVNSYLYGEKANELPIENFMRGNSEKLYDPLLIDSISMEKEYDYCDTTMGDMWNIEPIEENNDKLLQKRFRKGSTEVEELEGNMISKKIKTEDSFSMCKDIDASDISQIKSTKITENNKKLVDSFMNEFRSLLEPKNKLNATHENLPKKNLSSKGQKLNYCNNISEDDDILPKIKVPQQLNSKSIEKISSKLDTNAKHSFENVLLNQLNKNHYDRPKQKPPSIQKSMDVVHQPNYLSKLLSLQPQSFRSNENIQTNQENVRDKSSILKQSEN